MKYIVILILGLSLVLIQSCHKNNNEYPENCQGYSAGIYKLGNFNADCSYQNYEGYATYARNNILLTVIDEYCAEKMQVTISNIVLNDLKDTVFLKYSELGLGEFPTATLNYRDADAISEQYDLIEAYNNWLIIESINKDSSIFEGTFDLSFITTYEPYLNNEKERWDDPNRPDTLHFRNGFFEAVIQHY